MRRPLHYIAIICLGVLFMVPPAMAQPGPDIERNRLAQTGMKFLSVTVNPRAAAMANAVTARRVGSASLFGNPAGMAGMAGTADVSLSQVEWFANYKYGAGSIAFRPAGGRYGSFGLTLVSVDYGQFQATIRADNEKGFEDVGSFSPSALAIGLGYARTLTDRFSVGGQVKFVRQTLGVATMGFDDAGDRRAENNVASVAAFDFGVIYHTGFRSLDFAVSARNFAREVTYAEESFELPLTFRIGASMDMTDFSPYLGDAHDFVLAVDAERPRDYHEMLRVGAEYAFMGQFFVRGGYALPTDEEGLNAGAGVRLSISDLVLRADYAYTEFGRLGDVHRIGVELGF